MKVLASRTKGENNGEKFPRGASKTEKINPQPLQLPGLMAFSLEIVGDLQTYKQQKQFSSQRIGFPRRNSVIESPASCRFQIFFFSLFRFIATFNAPISGDRHCFVTREHSLQPSIYIQQYVSIMVSIHLIKTPLFTLCT